MPLPSPGVPVGKHFSEGARLLWRELVRRGLDVEGGRRLLGFAGGVLNRYLSGEMRPGIIAIDRIHDILKIAPLAFARDPKRPFVAPVGGLRQLAARLAKKPSRRRDRSKANACTSRPRRGSSSAAA